MIHFEKNRKSEKENANSKLWVNRVKAILFLYKRIGTKKQMTTFGYISS